MYGSTGVSLEIDLTGGKIEKPVCDPEVNEAFLGGRGINTKLFWDRVDPAISPSSPDNLLIFSTGVLTGTSGPGANRTVVTTRSLQTNLLSCSSLGGFWGPELKHAGYDSIIFSGKSDSPVYVGIQNDSVNLFDASHLWGRDVKETQRILRKELNNNRAQILCIGPAGENRVAGASIEHSTGASASRSVGAVMGDKKIKAIAVFGTKDLHIAHPERFRETCESILKKSEKIKKYLENWSHEVGAGIMNAGVYGNMGSEISIKNPGKLHSDFLNEFRNSASTCYNCTLACKYSMSLPGNRYAFIKCQSWFVFMFATKIQDLAFNLACYHLCERYGLDSVSVARYIGFAIDLYEKGILTKTDTDGMELRFGNRDTAFTLIEKIARREGIGDLLANGLYEAARQIGKGAESYAYHNKKLELSPYALYVPHRAIRAAITDKADITRAGGGILRNALSQPQHWKDAYLQSGFFPYPEALEKYFLSEQAGSTEDYEDFLPVVSYDVDRYALCDCTGICIFWTGFFLYTPILPRDHLNLIYGATGIALDEIEMMEIAKRLITLTRAYNVRTGLRREDDIVPERYFQKTDSMRFLDRNKFNKMLETAYALRGWNKEGIPKTRELERLGLDYVKKALEKNGSCE